MGHRIPPISTRIGINRGFNQLWYSDLYFSMLYFKDMTNYRYAKLLIHRYYKHKVRFLRGKHRRRRSTLRVASIVSKRLYEKTIFNVFNYRQTKKNKKFSLFIPLYRKRKRRSISKSRIFISSVQGSFASKMTFGTSFQKNNKIS